MAQETQTGALYQSRGMGWGGRSQTVFTQNKDNKEQRKKLVEWMQKIEEG